MKYRTKFCDITVPSLLNFFDMIFMNWENDELPYTVGVGYAKIFGRLKVVFLIFLLKCEISFTTAIYFRYFDTLIP